MLGPDRQSRDRQLRAADDDALIAARENLLNSYRRRHNVDTAVVLGIRVVELLTGDSPL